MSITRCNKRKKLAFLAIFAMFTLVLVYMFYLLPSPASATKTPRVIEISAKQFAFDPAIIKVNMGEEIIFRVSTEDVTHGFFIDGFDVYVDIPPGEVIELGPIKFDKPGKFKIRCSTICGALHPFMVADIIVEPNIPFYMLIIGSLAIMATSVAYIHRSKPKDKILGIPLSKEVDILKIKLIGPILEKIVKWRGYHFFIILPNALIFMIVLTTGFFGNPTGALNFSIAVVWILWFAAVEFMILLASRFWCSICPLPAFGEWLARRRLYSVHEPRKWFSLKKIYPKSLRNMWVPALGFLGISLIVPWLVTRPVITGFLFLTLIVGALIIHLVYGKRYFCLYLCPASGYIGHHSSASILAVRSRDPKLCEKCVVKGCVRGTPKGYGCPWDRYPGGNDSNVYCGLDLECLKACPLNNMTLKIRMIAKDIATKIRASADEAWMGFIRFTLVIFYTLVFFGPYFWIKDWGNMGIPFGANLMSLGVLIPSLEGFRNWAGWALIVTLTSLIVFPLVFLGFVWVAKKVAKGEEKPTKHVFLALSNALTPYALLLWISFAIALVSVNWAYPIRAFSDPLGWGWDIVGTRNVKWMPFMPEWIPYVQSTLAFIGFSLATDCTYKIALNLFQQHTKAFRATLVMSILYLMILVFILWIIMG